VLEGAAEEEASVTDAHGEDDAPELDGQGAGVRKAGFGIELERTGHDPVEACREVRLERDGLDVALAREADGLGAGDRRGEPRTDEELTEEDSEREDSGAIVVAQVATPRRLRMLDVAARATLVSKSLTFTSPRQERRTSRAESAWWTMPSCTPS